MIWKIFAFLIWATLISTGLLLIRILPSMPLWGYLAVPIICFWIFAAIVGVMLWNE